MSETTPEPITEPAAGNLDTTTVELPEQTDNGVKPEDGEQDVEQTPAPVEGSPTDEVGA